VCAFRVEVSEPCPKVQLFERVDDGGWGLGMPVVRFPDGGTLVYSPTWLGDDTFERVERVGRPAVLLAPNHFHHLSLARFRAQYPDAAVVGGETGLARLRARGHHDVHACAAAAARLPAGVTLLEPPGLKNGEVFVCVDGDGGPTWLVCDAFHNVVRPVTGPRGAIMRWLRILPGLTTSRVFRLVGLGDRPAFKAWMLEALEKRPPRRMVFCHGATFDGADLAERLRALVVERV
jgi:hypothetical protein